MAIAVLTPFLFLGDKMPGAAQEVRDLGCSIHFQISALLSLMARMFFLGMCPTCHAPQN